MIHLEFFCIVDGRRIFNSSQLDNSIFHDLGFDKPLYGQNSIPTDGFPQQLCIMNYHGTHVRVSTRGGFPRCVDSPNNYALRIMNYELR